MPIKQSDLDNIICNPTLVQKTILEEMENNHYEIGTATNPFLSLLEVAVSTASSAVNKTQANLRKQFPYLATTKEELLYHITDQETTNLFSTPSQTELHVEVNILNMKNSAYKPKDKNYRETMLPMGTTIRIANYPLTLLNDILIRIYDGTEQSYVESLINNNNIAFNNMSVIESKIIHNNDNIPFITFKIPVKQVTKNVVKQPVNKSLGFNYTYNLTDKYYYSEVYYSSNATGNTPVRIEQTFNENYLDPYKPKVYIKVMDGEVRFNIPSIYITNGTISGTITLVIYETKGKTFLPLNHYTRDRYEYTLGDSDAIQASTAPNITFAFHSESVIDGGTDGMSTEELRDSIINHKLGPINVPVTNYQIEKIGNNQNYNISLVEDVLTNRLFIASKDLDTFNSNLIKAMPDTFNNTTMIPLVEYQSAYPSRVKEEDFIIKSNSVFLEQNGIMRILTPHELKLLNEMPLLQKIEHMKTNKYFFNIFTYVVSKNDGITECKVYHMDNPKLMNVRYRAKNQNLGTINAYLEKHDIKRLKDGYRILIQIKGDTGYNRIEQGKKRVQISVTLISGEFAHYRLQYDENLEAYTVDLKVDEMITKENRIVLLNGNSNMSLKLSDLFTNMYVYTYIVDRDNYDPTHYLVENIDSKEDFITVLSQDTVDILFGKEVKYLWNKVYNTYTNRKYKTYQEDIYKTYTEDVYERDIDGKLLYRITQNNRFEVKILHRAGDFVLDNLGQKVLLHKKGDPVLDSEGKPVIDSIPGVLRYIDMLMLEYEFMIASGSINNNLRTFIIENFENILFSQLPSMNTNLLERTSIYYRAPRSTAPLELNINGVNRTVPYRVNPTVRLYVDPTVTIDLHTQDLYKTTIGKLINKELTKKIINLNEIKEKIQKALDIAILGIKIENLTEDNSEIIHVKTKDNALVLDKSLSVTEYKETIVEYNIDLIINKVK